MKAPAHDDPGLARGPLLAIGALLCGVIVAVAGVRLSGADIRVPDAPATEVRSLRFEDRADGSIVVIDAANGAQIDRFVGEHGFVRGALRGLVRERRRQQIGAAEPFQLVARADGRLTLMDRSTGQRVDLESFGPVNAADFGRLLRASPDRAIAQGVQP